MMDLAILGLLADGPRHGYQVRRRLHELGFRRISFGSLYPAIRRLEARGLISAVRSSGRRKEYRITEDGTAAFENMLGAEVDDGDERQFRMRLAFFAHLDPGRRIAVLEDRRSVLTDRLVELRKTRKVMTPEDPYPLALVERSVTTTEGEISWLGGLIAGERSSGR